MLMHQGIGLDSFNAMPSGRAVHALYECCCNVTWARKVTDARPYGSYRELFATADLELLELSPADIDRVFDSCVHEPISERSREVLAKISQRRIERMLGPEDGWPEYG